MSGLKEKVQNALDESRMLILGGQVLLGFSAQSVLQAGFPRLSHLARLGIATGAAALLVVVCVLLWPAAYHAWVWRGRLHPAVLRASNTAMCISLLPFAVGLSAVCVIVGERVLSAAAGVGLGAMGFAGAMAAWYALPAWLRRRRPASEKPVNPPQTVSDDVEVKIHHVLTEARMVLPGAQALLGFASIAVLTDRFDRLSAVLKAVHVGSFLFIVCAVILLMMPAAYHRIVEHGEHTERFHRIATRLLLLAMAALAPGLAGTAWIIAEIALASRAWGVAAFGATLASLYAAWFGWTMLLARRTPK